MLPINVCINHWWAFPSWHKEQPSRAAKATSSPEKEAQGPFPPLLLGSRELPPELLGSAEKALAQTMTRPQRGSSSPFQGPSGLSSR